MKAINAVWKFSRPHTIIGSVISIVSLYIILCRERTEHLVLLSLALIAGIASNIFIVGLNQIADVNIDRINKPWLPIPAEHISIRQAKIIVSAALIISLSVSLYMTPYFFAITVLACAIGWAYSMPPFHLKRHHLPAAVAISFVRGILVNLGAFLVFSELVDRTATIPENLKMLTIFITVCGIVIAWFKDLPDVKGDAAYNMKTFAVVHTPKIAFITGNVLMTLAYLFPIVVYATSGIPESPLFTKPLLLYGHVALFILFTINSLTIRLKDHRSVQKFYKRFWFFFFAEYLLYMIAYL